MTQTIVVAKSRYRSLTLNPNIPRPDQLRPFSPARHYRIHPQLQLQLKISSSSSNSSSSSKSAAAAAATLNFTN